MPGPFYMAYLDAPVAFNAAVHNVEDEAIVYLKISQQEGEFASLEIDVLNPGVGLLAPGRKLWCWLSWFNGTNIIPLFTGRLTAVPQQISGESMRLLFTAKPVDYDELKADLADSLKVLPYWDPVWITGDKDDPDALLNTYGGAWHIDRVTHAVTMSDDLQGEDGTINVGESDHTYDSLEVTYAQKPKRKFVFEGTLTWKQTGAGTIDLTERIYNLFRTKKSIYIAPQSGVISTLTGEGLKSSWPKAGTSLGGGWTFNADTEIEDADRALFAPYTYQVAYWGMAPGAEPTTSFAAGFLDTFTDLIVKFPIGALKQTTKVDWEADKDRTEILAFTMIADVQPLDEDEEDATETLTISASDTVTEPDDDDEMPIGDRRRISYLNTARGAYSVQHALLLGRTTLRRYSRAVEISIRVPWLIGYVVTLRKSVYLADRRLPSGGTEATGKVISYDIVASGDGNHYVDITFGCAVGRGGTVTGNAGTGTYAEPGYMQPGYQVMEGADVTGPTEDIVYQDLSVFEVDDDGVDLLTLDENTAVESLTLSGGLSDQVSAVTGTPIEQVTGLDPVDNLKQVPSRVCLELYPVAGVSFETTYSPAVYGLPIPKMIDLEAA